MRLRGAPSCAQWSRPCFNSESRRQTTCFAGKEDKMRLLHTMLRVGDLDRSIDFYTHVLGMKLLRRKDYPGGKFTLAFVGYDTKTRLRCSS